MKRYFLAMLLGCGGLLIAAAAPIAATEGKPVPRGLWQAFGEARHIVVDDRQNGGLYRAYNPKNRYGIRYDEAGIALTTSGWTFGMRLDAYGQEAALRPLGTAAITREGSRVTYAHESMEAWYVNTPAGLEQGFTLFRPEGYDGGKNMVLSFALTGGLIPKWKQEGNSITFYKGGVKAFDYEKLYAYDADKKRVPAALALSGGHLQIRIDAKNAAWPVTVDPVFATEQKVVGMTSDARENAVFGYAVAIDGDTALIGAYGDDESADSGGAAYVLANTAAGWVAQAKLTASDAVADAHFGRAVALDGDTALVGADGDDENSTNTGAAYVFTRNGSNAWSQQFKLTASDGIPYDNFGYAVALDGDTALVGAYGDDDNGSQSGAAYVFTGSGSAWTQQAKLTASDATGSDFFGRDLALYADTALIGAYGDDDNGSRSGSAYVFTRSGSSWTQEAKLIASDASEADRFGYGVALDADTAVIGAYLDDHVTPSGGSAYVFTRSGSSWTQEAKLEASDVDEGDIFGQKVAVSGDTALIGSRYDDDNGYNSGSAYVFVRSGSSWSQEAKLTASDGNDSEYFGFGVALDEDAALVGAYNDNDGGNGSGSAYLFARSGSSWTLEAKLTAREAANNDNFGVAVALTDDTALIGAEEDDDGIASCGAAYVFVLADDVWTQQAKLTPSDGADGDSFGHAVAVVGDTALVGADDDDDGGNSSGSAYVFVREDGSWTQEAKLVASDADTAALFGSSVVLSGDRALIGARGDSGAASAAGAAYTFTRSGGSWSQEAKLAASDADAVDLFGYAVDLDGDTALVGSIYDDDSADDSGAAYVFAYADGNWTQEAKLLASDGGEYNEFGTSVALSGDSALVGAPYENTSGTGSGAAYVFTRSDGSWSQEAKLTGSDTESYDYFGDSVALYGDTALIGAYGDDDIAQRSGAAYVFVRAGTAWYQQTKLMASDGAKNDYYGDVVALYGDTALAGAYYDDDQGSNSGSAYFNRFACGFAGPIVSNTWTMIGLPCDPGSADTVEAIFGDTLDTEDYTYRWVIYQRNESTGNYEQLSPGSSLTQGRGYWLLSLDGGYWDVNGSLTQFPVTSGCADAQGCFEYTLQSPANADGYQFNLVGYPVDINRTWAGVKYTVDGTAYDAAGAENAGYVDKSMWLWNGNAYETYDDSTPGMEGEVKSHQGFWVRVLGGASGKTVKILIPKNSVLGTPPPAPSL